MISILCPSRGRPQLASNLVSSALSSARGDIEILLYLNDDDEKLDEYLELIDNRHIIIGKDRSPVYSLNKLSEISKGEICFLSADHLSFTKDYWDDLVYEKFDLYNDKIAFVYPSVEHLHDHDNKQLMTEWFCPFYFLHKNWINTMGYFACPAFWHWFPDKYALKIAQNLNRREIIREVMINCVSFKTDPTDSKKNHLCNRERDIWLYTSGIVNNWIQADSKRLQEFIENYEEINSNTAGGR